MSSDAAIDAVARSLAGQDGMLGIRVFFDMNSAMALPDRRLEVLRTVMFPVVRGERWSYHTAPVADVVWYAARVTPREYSMLLSARVFDGVRVVIE